MRACLRACIHALLSVCVCVCVCVRRDQLEVIWRATAPFSTSQPCSRYTLVFPAPRRAKNVPKQLAPHSYQGTAAFIIPTTTPTAQHSHTHTVHTPEQTFIPHWSTTGTHTHTHRAHQKYSILSDNDDWCRSPPPPKKKETLCSKANGGRLHKSIGWEGRHWKPTLIISQAKC